MNSDFIHRVLSGAVALGFVSLQPACDSNPIVPEDQQLVVQAYLYEGEPVDDITVMLSRPLSSTDTVNAFIVGADAVLKRGGSEYQLTDVPSEPGKYEYTGTDLVVNVGDKFDLEVDYDGISVSASTIVPEGPIDIRLNADPMTFKRETFTTPFGDTLEGITSSDSIVVLWDNPAGESHYVVIENNDPNRQVIRTDSGLGGPFGGFQFRLVAQPTTAAFYRILAPTIEYTGLHEITVYRVNQEYVDLYRSREQDSRSLNEPRTNIRNGMGVFTAFSGRTITMTVVVQ